MDTVREKVAYLRGLVDGTDLASDGKQGKAWDAVLSLFEEISLELEDIRMGQVEFEEYIEAIDEDLCDLEDEMYGDEDDEDDLIEMDCPHCGMEVEVEDDDVFVDEDVEIVCPNCGQELYAHSTVFAGDDLDGDSSEV